MTDALKLLVETARKVPMSLTERETQRRSFAYGNTHFENDRITREMIDREAEKMSRDHQRNEK
jgi:hypothetical protein